MALVVPGSRTRHVFPSPSVNTYPVSVSPKIFQFFAPQCEHLASLTSIGFAASASLQDFLEMQVPSSSSLVGPSIGLL